MEPNSDLLRYAEAAKYLGMPEITVRKRVSAQTIPHIKLGPRGSSCRVMFSKRALDEWLAAHAVPAREPAAAGAER